MHSELRLFRGSGFRAHRTLVLGRYWIDETGEAIVVHLEGSITPTNTGQEFTRITRASADQLLIRFFQNQGHFIKVGGGVYDLAKFFKVLQLTVYDLVIFIDLYVDHISLYLVV